MINTLKKIFDYFIKFCFILIILFICLKFKENGVDGLVNFLEHNYFISVFAVIFLYVFKSFVYILPVSIVCISVSLVFDPLTALIINFTGYVLEIITGYFMGIVYKKDFERKGTFKKKKISGFIKKLGELSTFKIALTRFIPFFPNDIMSSFYGASYLDFKKYLIGSVIGYLPWILGYSFAGISAENPFSIQFIGTISALLIIALISVFIYRKIDNNKDGLTDERS